MSAAKPTNGLLLGDKFPDFEAETTQVRHLPDDPHHHTVSAMRVYTRSSRQQGCTGWRATTALGRALMLTEAFVGGVLNVLASMRCDGGRSRVRRHRHTLVWLGV